VERLTQTKSLDLGSGATPRNPFNADSVFGIDIVNYGNPNIFVADLAINPIPSEDSTYNYVTGFDFLEHVPRVLYLGTVRKQPFIDLMNEIWRVLLPGGIGFFSTPAFPRPEAFQDPQHVNYITEATIQYFCGPNEFTGFISHLEICKGYGFLGEFEAIGHHWSEEHPSHLVWALKAVK
jgi:SAM-dependent methyltransferase